MNLRKSRLTESIDWPQDAPEVRITVSTLNALMSARYQALLGQLHAWFFDQTGESLKDIDDWDDATLTRCANELNFGVAAAQNMASILYVEIPTEKDGEVEWARIPTPADWLSFEGYLENIDPELSSIWNEAAQTVNPDLWQIDETDEGKKKEAASANG